MGSFYRSLSATECTSAINETVFIWQTTNYRHFQTGWLPFSSNNNKLCVAHVKMGSCCKAIKMIVILFASGDQDILLLNICIMTGLVIFSVGHEEFSKLSNRPVTFCAESHYFHCSITTIMCFNSAKLLDCWDFSSEVFHIHLARLQSTRFSVSLGIPSPIRFLLVVKRVGSNW